MRAVAIATAFLAGLATFAATEVPASGPKPVVLLVGRAPLTISGWRFGPGERLVVTLVRAQPRTRQVVADRNGRFFVTFASVRVGRCSSVLLTVVSRHGTTKLAGSAPDCRSD